MIIRKIPFSCICALAVTFFISPASSHNVLDSWEGNAGMMMPMTLNVNHGCKGEPVIGLRIQVPEGVTDAKAAFDPNWDISYKMRKLETPITAHGREVNEVVGEIVWSNPVKAVPADGWYPFKFRWTLPKEVGAIHHVKNITVCENSSDGYVDLPEQALNSQDPEFPKKSWGFMFH